MIPHSRTHYTLSSAKLQALSSPMPLGLAAPTRQTSDPWRPLSYGIMRGRFPSSWGVPARSVLSKHKHRPKDNTSVDLVIGLWAGRREGAGCPLRWEDGTRSPLCQQLLRHLFPPAFGSLPPPTSEQPCLSCSVGTGSLTPAMGLRSPGQHLPAWSWQSKEAPVEHGLPALTPLLGLGRAAKGGQVTQAFYASLTMTILSLGCLGESGPGIQSPGAQALLERKAAPP